MAKGGARIWYFPDGYLPQKKGTGTMASHEALMLLNVGGQPARVKLDFYFEGRDPIKDVTMTVGGERVICVRLDDPKQIGGLAIPELTQYSIRVRSDVPIVAQFGRLDVTQPNLAYYTAPAICEDE